MALNHTPTVSKNEPPWETIEVNRLPRNAHADMGDPNDQTTWNPKTAHHWVMNPVIGLSGRYTKGQQFLHEGRLKELIANTKGMTEREKNHIRAHAEALNLIEEPGPNTTSKKVFESEAKSATKTKTVSYGINNFSLRKVAEAITACQSLEALKSLENQCLLHFSKAEQNANNWIEENRARSMSDQVQQLVSLRRRQILALPKIEKERAMYALGRAIGQRT